MKNKVGILVIGLLGFSSFAFAKEVVLDVRTPKEFQQEHVVDAKNIDFLNEDFKVKVAELNRDDTYKIYCRSGRRSAQAIAVMKELGFKNLENLGGLEDAKKVLGKSSSEK